MNVKEKLRDLEMAEELISNYQIIEFGNEFDLSLEEDLSKVGLAYTTLGDNEEYEIQVEADLLDYKLNTFIDGKLFESIKHESLEEFIETYLSDLDFDGLVSVSIPDVEEFLNK